MRPLTTRILVDLGLVVGAYVLAWAVRSIVLPVCLPGFFETSLYPLSKYLSILPVAILAWALGLWAICYRPGQTGRFLADSVRIVFLCSTATVAFALLIKVFRLDEALLGDSLSRFFLVLLACLSALLLVVETSFRLGWAARAARAAWTWIQAVSRGVDQALAPFWPTDWISLTLLLVGAVNFIVLSALVVYEDPVIDYPLMIGDAQDWVANGLYFLGHPVAYSARPPLYPLILAAFASLSLLKLAPVFFQALVLVTGLALYRMLSESCDRLLTALATLAWLTNATWIWWSVLWQADVPAACLLGWALILWQRRNSEGQPGYVLAGLAAGMSAVTHPIAVLLAIPVLVSVVWHRRADLRSRAFVTGAALFVAPGIVWAAVRWRLVGTLGDVIYRNWGAVGLHIGSVDSSGWFYTWALVALVGIPAVVPIAIGMWTVARQAIHSDWATLVAGGFFTIMAFLLVVYDSDTARFLTYVYPFMLVFLVLGLCRIRRFPVAVSLALIVAAWGFPLREEMMKWPRIVIWPYPSLELKISAQNRDGVWTLVPGLERAPSGGFLDRSAHITLLRIRGSFKPPRLDRALLESDHPAVYLTETGGYQHRLYHQTRLGNQLRNKVYRLPFFVFAASWPLAPMERLGFQDAVVLYRFHLQGESGSHLVALTPGGRAERKLAEAVEPKADEEDSLTVARRVAPFLDGSRLLVLCGPRGVERWQAYLPFLVDVIDLWYVDAMGIDTVKGMMGAEERSEQIEGIVISERRIHGVPWLVLGASHIDAP
jgi:hypothetical protein